MAASFQEKTTSFLISFLIWWMALLPFDYAVFDFLFKTFQKPIFGFLRLLDHQLVFETDTYGMYVIVAFCFVLAIPTASFIEWIATKRKWEITNALKTLLAGILFFFLIKYGWDKVIKVQFYKPEPNTLYTPFGKLSKDIAFWSLVGSSYAYTVILGYVELLAALLLLRKRTQFLASILSIGIFGQIFLINYSFDISVKLLSGCLLLFSIFYTLTFPRQWRAVFLLPEKQGDPEISCKSNPFKWVFVLAVLLETLTPAIISGNFNDDNQQRIAHVGAYRLIGSTPYKRFYLHSRSYLIIEDTNGKLVDFKINTSDPNHYSAIDPNNQIDFQIHWSQNTPTVYFNGNHFPVQQLPYEDLPLLQNGHHAFSDHFH